MEIVTHSQRGEKHPTAHHKQNSTPEKKKKLPLLQSIYLGNTISTWIRRVKVAQFLPSCALWKVLCVIPRVSPVRKLKGAQSANVHCGYARAPRMT